MNTPDFTERLAQYRGTRWQRACLVSIRDDAECADLIEWMNAAQCAIDGDMTDLDWLIADADEHDRWLARGWAFEQRTGKCSDWMEA